MVMNKYKLLLAVGLGLSWILILPAEDIMAGDISLQNLQAVRRPVIPAPMEGDFLSDKGEPGLRATIGKQSIEISGEIKSNPLTLNLKPGDFVDSVIWPTSKSLLLGVWTRVGQGASVKCIILVEVDQSSKISCRFLKARDLPKGLVVMRLIGMENKRVMAMIRLGENDASYFSASLDIDQLPHLPNADDDDFNPK